MTDQEANTNKVYNSDRTGYVEFTNLSKNISDSSGDLIHNFTTTLELDSNRKITLNYDEIEFKNKNFDKLIKIEPENTKLSEDEKIEVLKKLGNLIAKAFVPFYKSRDFTAGTKLFKKVTEEFLGKEKAANILTDDYTEFVIEAALNYAKENNLCIRNIFFNTYAYTIDTMIDHVINKFNNDPENFVINFLDKDFEGNSLVTFQTFDFLRKELKEDFFNKFCKEEFFEKLSPKQYGKLSAIISRTAQGEEKINISDILKQMASRVNNNYETKINDFSKSFCETTNDMMFRKNEPDMSVGQYSQSMINFLKYLDNDYKNIIIADMCNIMPNYIASIASGTTNEKGLSKLLFINTLNEQFDRYKIDFKINETTRYASILDSLASYSEKEIKEIKNFKEIKKDLKDTQKCGAILADLVFSGKIEGDTIQKYFKSFEKCGFPVPDIVEAAINNISNRDTDSSKKEELANKLCNESKNYKNQEIKNTKNIFKKIKLKMEIKNIKNIEDNISNIIFNTTDVNTKKSASVKLTPTSLFIPTSSLFLADRSIYY